MNYSVIIPHRDNEALLDRAINSIPEREDIEIIVVDNSVKKLAQDFFTRQVVLLFSSYERGAGGARNEGLSVASGDYILFLDCDDIFAPNAWLSFDSWLGQTFDVVCFKTESINLDTNAKDDRNSFYNEIIESTSTDVCYESSVKLSKIVPPWSKLIRRKFLLRHNIRFEEVYVSNDVFFSYKIAYFASQVYLSRNIVYTVSVRSGSLVKQKSRENEYTRFLVMARVWKWLDSRERHEMKPGLLKMMVLSFRFGPFEFYRYLLGATRVGYRLEDELVRRIFKAFKR